MTEKIMTIEDAVYEKLKSLGFTDERIALMPKDELKIWVTAVIKEYYSEAVNDA